MWTKNDSKTGGRVLAVALALGLAGCPGDPTPGIDAGVMADAPVETDAPIETDAGADDAPEMADAGTEICVRSACFEPCGLDAAAADAALVAGLVPVASYCRSPAAWAAVGSVVYEVSTRTEGMTTHFDLSRWTATPGTSAPTPELLGTTSRDAATVDELTFLGGYVAVSTDEAHAVFGFTTYPGTVGGVFDVATGDGVVVATDASGNFDAAFLDGTRCIVNGLALGATSGQGLYELAAGAMGGAMVAGNMGDASGSVAPWASAGLLLAGGASYAAPFPTGEYERVFFVDPADLSATTPADLGASAPFLAIPSAFELLPGDQLASVVWGATAIDHIEVRTISVDAVTGEPSATAPTNLTTGDLFTYAAELGGDIALQHAGGILVVRVGG